MSDEIADDQLPPGVWLKKLPKKIGAITLIRNFLADNILTKLECEFVLIYPITLLVDLRIREFYKGSEVPRHRDTFEPIFGLSVNLLLQKAKVGGEFQCERVLVRSPRLYVFNGTRYFHSVTRVEEGARKSLIASLHFAPWPAPRPRPQPSATAAS